MAVSQSLTVTQGTQSVANNTTVINIKWTSTQSGASYNDITKTAYYYVSVNGGAETKYSVSYTLPKGTTKTIVDKNITVSHNSSGECTVKVRTYMSTGISAGVVEKSVEKKLTTIPRKSTLSANAGTLGIEQTLAVSRKSTSFTHTITYKCGSASGTVCTKSSDLTPKWTPPISLAQQNTKGTSVSVTFTITTYNGNTSIGSDTKTITCSIPASVKPSVSLSVSDAMGYADTFGGYVQGQSKFKIVVTISEAYGSPIIKHATGIDGKTYTTTSFTTSVISGKGSLIISAYATDSRGRTGATSVAVDVLPYSMPQISALNCFRCDSEGTATSNGGNLAIVFDSTITPLNNKNSAAYELQYKKAKDDKYTTEPLTEFAGQYSVAGGVFILPAETSSSYNIKLVAKDSFTNTIKTTTGASIRKWFSILKSTFGFAIGKVAELGGVFDIALQTRFSGGILHPVLEPNTDLNDVRVPNTYVGANLSNYNYTCGGNALPLPNGTFTLEVVGAGPEGQVKQKLISCGKTSSRTFERYYFENSWGDWICVSDFDGQLLWQGGWYMTAGHITPLSEPISKQRSGIVLVFSAYADGTAKDIDYIYQFVPKYHTTNLNGCGLNVVLSTAGFGYMGCKYLLVYDTEIKGDDRNDKTGTYNGITYNNGYWVLRAVIGV